MSRPHKPATNPIVARIDAALAPRGISRSRLCIEAGLDPTFLQKMEARGPNASAFTDNLQALARAAGLPIDELLAVVPRPPVIETPLATAAAQAPPEIRRRIPILGMVAGSAVGHYAMSSAPVGYVQTPPSLEQVPGAYAVYVRNDSMSPMHQQGDLRFIHPHLPPRKDDSVVVQTRDAKGDVEAYIKLYDRFSQDWLVCRQINPEAEVKFKRDHVLTVHRVLTTNELFAN